MTINRACVILWGILFVVGFFLAAHKPLWCDELYGQKITVEGSSWGKILTGRTHSEGNNYPLYYSLQKLVISLLHFSLPDKLIEDFKLPVSHRQFNHLQDLHAQIVLRLLPDALMSTAIVVLVQFFWVRAGLAVGLMALLSALTSGMVWCYWVEARPYPLWFLLTLIQALFLIEIVSDPKSSKRLEIRLILCHWLLAASASWGFIQVIVAQLILIGFGYRSFKFHFWAGVLPVIEALIIVSGGQSMTLRIPVNPQDIIQLNFSSQLGSLILFYLTAYFCRQAWSHETAKSDKGCWRGLIHLPYVLIGLSLSIMALTYIFWRWPDRHDGIPVFCRHFIFLSALGVVMVPAMFADLWSRSRASPWWQGLFVVLFIVLLVSQLIEARTNVWFNG